MGCARMRDSVRAVVFAVDRVEAKTDRHHWNKDAQEGNERNRDAFARSREQSQQQERILRRRLPDLLDREIERCKRKKHDKPFEHAHAHAGEMVAQFLENHDTEPVQRRTFTPHGALPVGDARGKYRV